MIKAGPAKKITTVKLKGAPVSVLWIRLKLGVPARNLRWNQSEFRLEWWSCMNKIQTLRR